jgi:hypothetical protein
VAADAAVAPRPVGDWTPARAFLGVSAVYHLLLAAAGLAIDQTFPVGADAAAQAGSEHVFGIFETNGWHSLAGLLLGVLSLYFVLRPAHARPVAFALGLSQLGVVVAFAVATPATFWFASNGADQVVHAATAVGGIASALLTRRVSEEPGSPAS